MTWYDWVLIGYGIAVVVFMILETNMLLHTYSWRYIKGKNKLLVAGAILFEGAIFPYILFTYLRQGIKDDYFGHRKPKE